MTARDRAHAKALVDAIQETSTRMTALCMAAGYDPTHVETVIGLFVSSLSARAVYLTNVEAVLGSDDAAQARKALDALLLLAAEKAEQLDTTALLERLRQ